MNVQFVIETKVEIEPSDTPVIGIDRGVTNLVALSNDETVEGRKRDLRCQKRPQRKLKVETDEEEAKNTGS